jgi:hypothetical protein
VYAVLRDQILQLLVTEPAGLKAPEIRRRLRPAVSQPTLWRTLDRLRAEGRITVEGRARSTRYRASAQSDLAALRSLRLHECVARRIARHPDLLDAVRERLATLRRVNPQGRAYHDQWQALLEGPLPALLRALTEDSERSAALRKESPFTMLVGETERRRVFESTRAA